MSGRRSRLDRADAEAIALAALIFLAEDGGRLGRFLAETGIDAGDLKRSAGEPGTLAAVLDHVTRDESLLLVFAAGTGHAPEQVTLAAALMSGEAA